MNDKLEPQDELPGGGDEELMSDFRELFTEDELQEGADSADANVALDQEDLNLDVGLDGEVYAAEPLLDLDGEEPAAEVADDVVSLDAVLDEREPSAIPAPRGGGRAEQVASSPPATGAIQPSPTASALSRVQLIGGVVVLALGLLLSLLALWLGVGLSEQVDTLNQNVSELQQRLLAQSRRGSIAPQAQLGEQLEQLGQRVNELAVIVEGPVSHLRESNQQALESINMRLERLEQGQPLSAKAAAAPSPVIGEPPVQEAIAPAAKEEGWVINLLSLSSARMANSELERLRRLGIRADKQAVSQDGKTWYRLRVTGFASYEGAKAYIDTVQQQTGVSSAWVGRE